MRQYMISRTNEAFIVTHFLPDRTQEMSVGPTQVLGPLDNLERNAKDYVFSLGDVDGLFVVSQKAGIVLNEKEIKEYGI